MVERVDMNIAAVARATGIKVETIRWYESVGLIPSPDRSAGNYRVYRNEHVERLAFIKRSRDLGFTLREVRALLDLADHPQRDCAEVDRIARLHLVEVERKAAHLERLAGELRRIIDSCNGGNVADCRIVESLSASA
ncbi:MerR family transcriptional regulator [Aliidongia dinghuensis]|uniref:MerR family transcriptional regulator n=1 Tax=Aliidongia dinghuensis TaxID=1867774 RepID=A0A8J3E1Z7_9PROT|nr:helix-turn-helix domain-containing protein [Aliidongia dinghuensis]GGF05532.1 MerR family transcriptional regulator [Aliidongia dinghuensis]